MEDEAWQVLIILPDARPCLTFRTAFRSMEEFVGALQDQLAINLVKLFKITQNVIILE